MTDQTVWFFEAPTIMWCTVHDTTELLYAPGDGLRCRIRLSGPACSAADWVAFSADPTEFNDAVERTGDT